MANSRAVHDFLQANAPTVIQALSNFATTCPEGLLFREDEIEHGRLFFEKSTNPDIIKNKEDITKIVSDAALQEDLSVRINSIDFSVITPEVINQCYEICDYYFSFVKDSDGWQPFIKMAQIEMQKLVTLYKSSAKSFIDSVQGAVTDRFIAQLEEAHEILETSFEKVLEQSIRKMALAFLFRILTARIELVLKDAPDQVETSKLEAMKVILRNPKPLAAFQAALKVTLGLEWQNVAVKLKEKEDESAKDKLIGIVVEEIENFFSLPKFVRLQPALSEASLWTMLNDFFVKPPEYSSLVLTCLADGVFNVLKRKEADLFGHLLTLTQTLNPFLSPQNQQKCLVYAEKFEQQLKSADDIILTHKRDTDASRAHVSRSVSLGKNERKSVIGLWKSSPSANQAEEKPQAETKITEHVRTPKMSGSLSDDA